MVGSGAQKALRIVVANDDPGYLDMMREVLTDFGYEVATCLSSDEAYEQTVGFSPDLIIVDLLFPGAKQGMELIAKLQQSNETQKVPIIVCSAATKTLHELEAGLQIRNTLMLYKPFTFDELLACIQQARGSPPRGQATRRGGSTQLPDGPQD